MTKGLFTATILLKRILLLTTMLSAQSSRSGSRLKGEAMQRGFKTKRTPVELKEITPKEVLSDLEALPREYLLSVAVSMAVILFPFNWNNQFEEIKKGLKQ